MLIGAMTVAGCSSHGSSNAFCTSIRRGYPAFDSAQAANATAAIAEFDRIAASAPAAVAPDLKFVSTMLRLFRADPATVDPATGIAIPPRGTL